MRRLPLYLGGLLGPFGTIVISPMFPELRTEFDASSAQVSLGFTLYLVPFALLLLVSGTLGERWGRRRTVRATYLIYAAASIVAVLAPSLWVFIAARAAQGAANAFITPLLLAGLAEVVPPEKLGREVGIYTSFQALGGGLGPVVGGIAADTSWQMAFAGTGALALILALFPPAGEPRLDHNASPRFGSLLNRRMIMLGLAFGFAGAGPIGISAMVGVAARDVLELSGTVAGFVMLAGSLSALVMGPIWGWVLDRSEFRTIALVGVGLTTIAAVLPSLATSGASLIAIWMLVGATISLTVVVFQSLGASVMPQNRGGALSFLLSFRFLGHAIGPLMFIPMLDTSLGTPFWLAASLGVVTFVLIALGLADSRPRSL